MVILKYLQNETIHVCSQGASVRDWLDVEDYAPDQWHFDTPSRWQSILDGSDQLQRLGKGASS